MGAFALCSFSRETTYEFFQGHRRRRPRCRLGVRLYASGRGGRHHRRGGDLPVPENRLPWMQSRPRGKGHSVESVVPLAPALLRLISLRILFGFSWNSAGMRLHAVVCGRYTRNFAHSHCPWFQLGCRSAVYLVLQGTLLRSFESNTSGELHDLHGG